VAQLLTETFVLALIGSLLGLMVANGASSVFRSLAANLPRVEEIHLRGRIVLYSLACSVIVTLLCGLVPAIRGTRRNLSVSLAQVSRTQVSTRNPFQWLLVGVQVALAVTLLAGAGLLLRSFQALGRVSPGFETGRILTLHISGTWGETADMKGLTQRIDRTIDSLRNTPGVEAAATSATLPGVPGRYQTEFKFSEGQFDPARKIVAESRFVSPGYFGTLRIPLLSGDLCQTHLNSIDILVNRSFQDTYLAGSPVLGRHIEALNDNFVRPGEIRGVVADAREEGLNRAPGPTVYWCLSAPLPDPYYLVRTRSEPAAMAENIRQAIHQIEPSRSVFDVTPLEDHLSEAFSENRLRTVLLSFFAATALSLACVGLYGTLSYSVNVRQREVGLRLALGALGGQILKQFLVQGLTVSILGRLAGWGLASFSWS
jgi:putative ABC transport system permease protein